MNLKKILFVLLVATSIIVGCSKDRIEEKELNQYASPNEYLETKKPDPAEQEYIIDSAGACPLIANEGTEICSSKDCFMLSNGDSIDYPYILKVIEIYKPKDYIAYLMSTIASEHILESAGTVRIRAFKNSNELKLRSGCSYQLTMPSNNPQNYYNAYYITEVAGSYNWSLSDNSVFAVSGNSHVKNIEKMGWVSCAVDKSTGATRQIKFVSETDELKNVAIFIYIPSTKTVMHVLDMQSGNIPEGLEVKILCIGVMADDSKYIFEKTMTISKNEEIEVTMQESSDEEIDKALNSL